ncbi:MAG: glutaredoxin family protein [Betaproteobacteria bacterium]
MAEPPHLVLYGRAYCHLCDDMVAALSTLQPQYGFSLEVVDVDADPALVARYDELVPVLTAGGAEICHYFLDRERLETALRAA